MRVSGMWLVPTASPPFPAAPQKTITQLSHAAPSPSPFTPGVGSRAAAAAALLAGGAPSPPRRTHEPLQNPCCEGCVARPIAHVFPKFIPTQSIYA